MRVAVTRCGPPTRMLGTLYAPPARVTARYCVPLGTCTATTVASASGVPSWAATTPLIAAVVTPCPSSVAGMHSDAPSSSARHAGSNRLVGFTQSSLAAGDGRGSFNARRSLHRAGGSQGRGRISTGMGGTQGEVMGGEGQVGIDGYRPLPPITADAESRHRP